jgi:hypothetical protein
MDQGLRRFAKESKVSYPFGKVADIAAIAAIDSITAELQITPQVGLYPVAARFSMGGLLV